MSEGAQTLLVGLLLSAAVALAARGVTAPPGLGEPHPALACAIPVEHSGRGVRCLSAAEAARAGLAAGDRVGPSASRERMAPARLASLGAAVDVNTATVEEIESLPGIGPVLAARIVAARPYTSLASLGRVSGIGPRKLYAIRPRVAFPPR